MAGVVKNEIVIPEKKSIIIDKNCIVTSFSSNVLTDFSSKSIILNYIFRNVNFSNVCDKIITIPKIKTISRRINLSSTFIDLTIRKFLLSTIYFKRVLNLDCFSWNNKIDKLRRKLTIYLHKAYRIAPVFNYKRAKKNAEILISLMNKRFYFPRITTQLTIIIFVTDLNAKNQMFNLPIIQKNLRVFCDCSAYAFHRARNKLRINNQGIAY